MNFSNWYEQNKEALTQMSARESLHQAWQDGYCVATKEMYKTVIDGMRGPHFRKAAESCIICEMCDYTGPLVTYKPCEGYADIRCPNCGSTKNEHNRVYKKKVFNI